MKLKLVAAISALAIPALAHAQQGGPQPKVPKPTKADAQNVVQIVTSDKVKMQAYCERGEAAGAVTKGLMSLHDVQRAVGPFAEC